MTKKPHVLDIVNDLDAVVEKAFVMSAALQGLRVQNDKRTRDGLIALAFEIQDGLKKIRDALHPSEREEEEEEEAA